MHEETESGRTLVETLATLGIIAIITVGAIKGYNATVTKVKAQNTAKMIKTLALERQNFAMGAKTASRTHVKGPHSELYVENGTVANHSKYFWVETSLTDSAFCNALKESELIQADVIEVDDVIDGTCTDNSKIAFYFKKNPANEETLTWVDGEGNVQLCPNGSKGCDENGYATACEDGYYLSDGECVSCGKHVASCEDENTPLTCDSGYELHWGQCITAPQMCRVDSDCDVCTTCDTETGYCQGECEVPTQRCYKDADCGENECIICDTDEHSCKYACERVEYLESTSMQYIDTGITGNINTKIDILFSKKNVGTTYPVFGVVGARGSDANNDNIVVGLSEAKIALDFNNSNYASYRYILKNTLEDTLYRAIISKEARQLYKEDTLVGKNTRLCTDSIQTGNIWLFQVQNYGAVNAKIYYCEIWDNNTPVRDFIPVHAPFQPEGKQNCMFDRVTKKLFCNKGSGDDFLIP